MKVQMKALTLWQPWASCVAIGAKRVETRSWSVEHRGALAIHASAETAHLHLAQGEPFRSLLLAAGLDPLNLPLGRILATCFLSAIMPMGAELPQLSAQELSLGDYSLGRFAWFLAEQRRLVDPVPAVGHQGLWNWEIPRGLIISTVPAAWLPKSDVDGPLH
jgi:hypothetical protein